MTRNGLEEQFKETRPGDVGIIGDPVAHSLSPIMQNAALHTWKGVFQEDGGRSPRYHSFQVPPDQLEEVIGLLKKYKLRGLNVTIPHKVSACRYMDSLDTLAKNVGAINTILNSDHGLIGYNTDGDGFAHSLHYDLEFDPISKKVLLLGAGGTARVILYKLLDMGVSEVAVWNRSADRAREMVAGLAAHPGHVTVVSTPAELKAKAGEADLVVNATSAGLASADDRPADGLVFRKDQFVFDVIYNRETRLLKEADAAGARVCGGLGMLVYQGAKSFQIWTSAPAPVEIMQHALQGAIKKV